MIKFLVFAGLNSPWVSRRLPRGQWMKRFLGCWQFGECLSCQSQLMLKAFGYPGWVQILFVSSLASPVFELL